MINFSKSRTRNYLLGLSSGYSVSITTIFIGLWLTPFTLRYLDREQYAIFTLASDILMWLTLLDLGISSSLNVQAAKMSGKPNQFELNRLVSTAFYSQAIISLVILFFGLGLALFFPTFFPIRLDLQRESTWVVGLMVLGSALTMGVSTFSALLIAHQQIYYDNVIRLFLVVFRAGLTVWMLIQGWGLLALPISNLLATLITSILAILRCYHLLPSLSIRWQLFSWEALRSTGSIGIWFGLGGLAGLVITNLDRIVTAKIISVEMVTTLSLTGRIYTLIGSLLQQITNTARPMIGQLSGQGKMSEVFRTYRHLIATSTGGTIIVAAALWAGNSDFVKWWVGGTNYGGSWLDMALAFNIIVHAWVLPNRAVLSANIIVKPQTISRIVEGVLNITLSVLLAYRFGIVGIVLSTAIAGFMTSNWFLPYLSSKLFNKPLTFFLKGDYRNVCILMLVVFPLAYMVKQISFDIYPLFLVIIKDSLVAIVGVIWLWFFVFDKDLRTRITKNGRIILDTRHI